MYFSPLVLRIWILGPVLLRASSHAPTPVGFSGPHGPALSPPLFICPSRLVPTVGFSGFVPAAVVCLLTLDAIGGPLFLGLSVIARSAILSLYVMSTTSFLSALPWFPSVFNFLACSLRPRELCWVSCGSKIAMRWPCLWLTPYALWRLSLFD